MTATLASYAGAVGTAFIAIILARAAWHKTAHPLETVGFAQAYGLLPERYVPAVVRTLAGLEWLAVIALVVPVLSDAGAWLAACLLAGYGIVMLLALRAGKQEIDCGCGGPPMLVSPALALRNAVYAGLAAALPFLNGDGALPALGALSAIAAGLTIWGVVCLAEMLGANTARIRKFRA